MEAALQQLVVVQAALLDLAGGHGPEFRLEDQLPAAAAAPAAALEQQQQQQEVEAAAEPMAE